MTWRPATSSRWTTAPAPHKVVHKEEVKAGYLVTFEADDGETFQLELVAGTPAQRALESKWESTQSPTPHS